jgi:glycosyltransferase 2 family protein
VTAGKHKKKLFIGILISLFFMALAFRKVDFGQMWTSLKTANYLYFLPAIAIVFLSHLLRAFRWRYLLDPIRRLDISSLFSSLIIGYAANVVTPAHLGEVLRSYVLSKKRELPMSAILATVVMERIIDVFSLLSLMVVAIFIHPFPEWVVRSGYIMFAATLGLLFLLVLLKNSQSFTRMFLGLVRRILPDRIAYRIGIMTGRFISGIVPLRKWHDYITVTFLSMAIWACYGLVFQVSLHAFGFVEAFRLGWDVSLILLVITCIAVVVPSSPGYVGPYHYLCQIALAMFAVPAGPALSYATVVHAISFLPVLLVGLPLANYEGMSLYRSSVDRSLTANVPEVI